jgi:hypothetical protein
MRRTLAVMVLTAIHHQPSDDTAVAPLVGARYPRAHGGAMARQTTIVDVEEPADLLPSRHRAVGPMATTRIPVIEVDVRLDGTRRAPLVQPGVASPSSTPERQSLSPADVEHRVDIASAAAERAAIYRPERASQRLLSADVITLTPRPWYRLLMRMGIWWCHLRAAFSAGCQPGAVLVSRCCERRQPCQSPPHSYQGSTPA